MEKNITPGSVGLGGGGVFLSISGQVDTNIHDLKNITILGKVVLTQKRLSISEEPNQTLV